MAAHLPCQDAWGRARNRYMEDLTHEEKQLYIRATPEMIFYDASAAEKNHEANSTSRGLMHKLQPFVAAIEQYSKALDVYANASPLALSPLWGSIRVLLKIAQEFGKYFEKLVDMFARIGDVLPQFQVYEKLFPDHERLIHAISVAYVDIIIFCSDAKAVFRRGQRASLTNFKVGFKLIWKPFESQFGQQLDNFRTHRKNVEKEAGLSHMIEAADARALVLANQLELQRIQKENEYQKIMAMIESVNVQAKHRKFRALRYNGTGDWVLQNDKYLKWKHASSTSSLCCYGIPGSGKSILASRIIDDILTTVATSVVYYYCDFADQRTLQTDRILGTVFKQLLPEGRFPEEIEPQILQAYGHGQRTPGVHEMVDLVCSLMQLHPVTYIIIDGLDECEKQARQEVLNILKRISALSSVSVLTYFSCRDEDELLRSLHQYPRIHLRAEALDCDIKSFVEGSVRSRIESGRLKIQNPKLENHIVQELVQKAQGMFLWVYFQLDDLCEAISDAMIRQILRDLPVGLVQTYERILLKISKHPLPKQEIALRAFKWMVCSRRPMRAEELQEAVAFDSSDHSWDRDKIPDKDLMIETCRGLLVRDKEDGTVRFAHYTVQQYLLSEPTIGTRFQISTHSEAEAYVGGVCITYLSFSDFETQIAQRKPDWHLEQLGVLKVGGPVIIPSVLGIRKSLFDIPYRLLGGHPKTAPLDIDYSKYLTPNRLTRPQAPSALTEKYRLLEYVICHWMDHIHVLEPALVAKLRRLVMFKTLSFEFRPWGSNQHFGHYGCSSCPDPTKAKELPFTSLFHYAAHAGHWSLMESLVTEYCQHEHPVDETFLLACRQGQDKIVGNLVRRIKFDVSDGRAIKVAVAAGQADVLNCLVEHEMEGYRASSHSVYISQNASSLLKSAATNGHEKVIDAIFKYCSLAKASYVNDVDEYTGLTALFLAVMNGHEKVVRKLLANGVDIMTITTRTSAFHIAAEYRHQDILRILLKAAAQIQESNNYTEMIEDENGSKTSHISLLLSHDNRGDIPLHKAARNGHSAAVESILDFQPVYITSRINARTINDRQRDTGHTAVHLAALGGHLSVLKILVKNKAQVNTRGGQLNGTALHVAAAEGHQPVVEWLLDNGADPRAKTNEGATALEVACEMGYEGIVRAFLERDIGEIGVDPDGNPNEGMKALEVACKTGHEGIVRTLLETKNRKFTSFKRDLMLVGLIESAAADRREGVLNTLLDCFCSFGEDSVGYAIRIADCSRERYSRAIRALKSLQKERRWEQHAEAQR